MALPTVLDYVSKYCGTTGFLCRHQRGNGIEGCAVAILRYSKKSWNAGEIAQYRLDLDV